MTNYPSLPPNDYRNRPQHDPDFSSSGYHDPEEFGDSDAPSRFTILKLGLLLIALFLGAVFACPLLAQPDPSLASATTDCGVRNTQFRINWSVPFTGTLESGKLRYGPCFGGGARCNDIGGVCIQTEAERQEAIAMLLALTAGTCSPPRGTLFPSEQTLFDWSLALLGSNPDPQRNRSGMDVLRTKYAALKCPPPGSGGQTTCPAGQSCRGECPACPSCPPCPPTTCPPASSAPVYATISSPPTPTPVDVWILPSQARFQAVYYSASKLYLLRSGVGILACPKEASTSNVLIPCVYAWQVIPSAPSPEASK